MILRVALNGTDTNPFAIYGATQNPFPQIAKYELQAHIINLQKLGGPPIPQDRPEEYIREVLKGWSEEFIQLCLKNYKPGEYVRFEVKVPYEE
jgi:hypothetical protein